MENKSAVIEKATFLEKGEAFKENQIRIIEDDDAHLSSPRYAQIISPFHSHDISSRALRSRHSSTAKALSAL
jgi:hypothetical protein